MGDMRWMFKIGLLLLVAYGSCSQGHGQATEDRLNADQVAVYRAFLARYTEKSPIKIVDRTKPIDMSKRPFEICFKDFGQSREGPRTRIDV